MAAGLHQRIVHQHCPDSMAFQSSATCVQCQMPCMAAGFSQLQSIQAMSDRRVHNTFWVGTALSDRHVAIGWVSSRPDAAVDCGAQNANGM